MSTVYPLDKDLQEANKLFILLTLITFIILAIVISLGYKLHRTVEANNRILDISVKKKTQELKSQKQYLQTILDNTPNMLILTNGKNIIDANRFFLEFFNYKSIEEFKKEHDCICDFFEEIDEKYFIFDKKIKDKLWVEHLLSNKDEIHKVKITLDEVVYFFSVKAEVFDEKNHVSLVILSDITKVQQQELTYREIASTDKLTQISNRFQFDILYEQEVKIAKRNKQNLSIIFFDLDKFKNVNDQFGHKVGDNVLIEIADVVKKSLRESDIFARWGGEEFIILLPITSADEAKKIAEHVRTKIENHHFKDIIKQTSSFGVATLKFSEKNEDLIKRADEALYLAKSNGRNRVEFL